MKKFKRKNVIIKAGVDALMPFALTFGLYIILFGTVSPGGGFQGGVIVACAVLMIYLGYGYKTLSKVINGNVLRIGEAIGAIIYVLLGFTGIFYGYNFCRNVFFNNGNVGDMISAGTITFMSWSVGLKVMMGVGFLLFILLGTLSRTDDEEGYVSEEDDK